MSVSDAGCVTTTHVQLPSANGGTADGGGSTDSSLLPEPTAMVASSGDVGAEIAAMAVQTGETECQTDDQARAADEAQQDREEASEVQAMRDEAGKIRESAIWTGASGAFQGAGEFGGGAVALNDGTEAGRAQSESWAAMFKGGGTAGSALTKVGAGMADGDKASLEADAAAHKAAADHAATAAGDMRDASSRANDAITQALSFYREYVSTQGQTWNAALHRS
jgi:hypothetical protein